MKQLLSGFFLGVKNLYASTKRALLLAVGLWFTTGIAFAAPSNLVPIPATVTSVLGSSIPHELFEAGQADWVFSGLATNENGEQYHYFFQMRRNLEQFYADAVLVDAQTNALILHESSQATISTPEVMQWQVGRNYLRFNTINNSWLFGVKAHDNKGFNFRIDMLGQSGSNVSKAQDLSTGLALLIGQSGTLNGHIQWNGHEEFVSAKKAWFRQMWVSKPQLMPHPFTGVLCDFKDGAGFYSVNLLGVDAFRGAMAGWRNEEGAALPMSQFVTTRKEKDGNWRIQVPYPKLLFSVADSLHKVDENRQLAAGAIKGKTPGFCVITQYALG
jgi:hypothetical protein